MLSSQRKYRLTNELLDFYNCKMVFSEQAISSAWKNVIYQDKSGFIINAL